MAHISRLNLPNGEIPMVLSSMEFPLIALSCN